MKILKFSKPILIIGGLALLGLFFIAEPEPAQAFSIADFWATIQSLQQQINRLLQQLVKLKRRGKEEGTLLLLVEDTLREGLTEQLNTYSNDIRREFGFQTIVKEFPSSASVFEVKSYIDQIYKVHQLKGVLLIGNLPTGKFYSPEGYYSEDNLPVYDYIYQDIYDACEYSSKWDAFNYLSPGCENNQIPPFWISRLTPNSSSENSLSLLKEYFKRNHNYRTGQYDYGEKILVYTPILLESAPERREGQEEALKRSLREFDVYNQENYSIIDPEKENSDQLFLNELKAPHKYENLIFNGHGAATFHQKDISSDDITNSNFFLGKFSSCSVGRFTTKGYIVGRYLFGGESLVAIAPPVPVRGPVGEVDSELYYLLSLGEPVFKALRISPMGGFNLFGDPTLKMRKVGEPDSPSSNAPSITFSTSSLHFTDGQNSKLTVKNTGSSTLEFKFYPRYYKFQQNWSPSLPRFTREAITANKYGHYLLDPGTEIEFEFRNPKSLGAPKGKYEGEIFVLSNDPVKPHASISFKAVISEAENHPPEVTESPTIPEQVKIKEPIKFTWKAKDPDNDNLSWSVNWGDGSGLQGKCVPPNPQNGENWSFSTTHSWSSPGTYDVKVTVSDCNGGSDSESYKVNVEQEKSISVTSPNGGEQWAKGEQHWIRWKGQNVEKVNVILEESEGNNNWIIMSGIPGDLEWNVGTYESGEPSEIPPGEYKVKIVDYSNHKIFDRSDRSFEITSSDCHPSSLWSWDYCSPDCQCDVGQGDCDSDADCTTGYCAQNVGEKYGQNSSIDVCEKKEEKSITVTSPEEGEEWQVGGNYNISWIYPSEFTGKTIELTVSVVAADNHAKTWTVYHNKQVGVSVNVPSGDEVTWTVPSDIPSGEYQVLISAYEPESTRAISSYSNKFFITGKAARLENIESQLASLESAISQLIERVKKLLEK